jgi:hypothetical protein
MFREAVIDRSRSINDRGERRWTGARPVTKSFPKAVHNSRVGALVPIRAAKTQQD